MFVCGLLCSSLCEACVNLTLSFLDGSDRSPVADGGPDLVVQPQDIVTLNGHQSRDDKGIESFQWKMLTEYPYARIDVRNTV